MEDFCIGDQMRDTLDSMLSQVDIFGEGISGNAAFNGKNQRFFSDVYSGDLTSVGEDIFKDASDIHKQFTPVVKVAKRQGILDQTKQMFTEMENSYSCSSLAVPPSSLNLENDDLNKWFASFCNQNITLVHDSISDDFMEVLCTPNLARSSAFVCDVQLEKGSPFSSELSSPMQLQVSLESVLSFNDSGARTTSAGTWCEGNSLLTSPDSQSQCEIKVQSHSDTFPPEIATPTSCESTEQNYLWQGDSALNSLYNQEEIERLLQECLRTPMNNQHSTFLVHETEIERETSLRRSMDNFKSDDYTTYPSKSCRVEDLSGCFDSSYERSSGGLESIVSEDFSQSGVVSAPSGLISGIGPENSFTHQPTKEPRILRDSFICNGEEKSLVADTASHDPLEGLWLKYGCGQAEECLEATMTSLISGANTDICTGYSGSNSGLGVGATVGSKKGLFSELGLEELLYNTESSKHVPRFSNNEQLSSEKRKRADSLSTRTHITSGSSKIQNSQISTFVDSYMISSGSAVEAKPTKTDELKKVARKRARPGESTRPRPKDRQLIQDRIKELRGIVPGGSKLSIDQLLDKAAKHMLFLQGATKLAEKLKQAHEPRLISNLVDIKTSCGGATWAMEVGNQAMVCPLIIEDLSMPGLMLIEMLCEDEGLFLEITDMIKGFGLDVLKGIMERRAEKIWAQFVVEAKTSVTRVELFLDLSKLLKLTAESVMDSTNQPGSLMSDNFCQSDGHNL